MTHCIRHFEEPLAAHCRTCNRPFCDRCLVFAFGPNKPPYCVGCALAASGIRNNSKQVVASAAPKPDRRAERALRRSERSEAKAAAKALKRAKKDDNPFGLEPEADRHSNVPMPTGLQTPASRYGPSSTEPAVR